MVKLLGDLDIVGKKKSPYIAGRDEAEVGGEVVDGYGSKDKPECNKLCVFDLTSKILLQVYGIAFSVVSKCGLG